MISHDAICYDLIIATLLQDLEAAVKKAVTGDLAALLLSLLMPPKEHDAYRFQQAMAVSMLCADVVGRSCLHPSVSLCFCV